MIWLGNYAMRKSKAVELRLYAPKNERIFLDFFPLKESDEPEWNPKWEEWHCYYKRLRIYQQDYNLLLGYFKNIYPTKDAFNGNPEMAFDVCFDNWIGKDDWNIIINEIKKDIDSHSENEKEFFMKFMEWLNEALTYTNIIVVEGNL